MRAPRLVPCWTPFETCSGAEVLAAGDVLTGLEETIGMVTWPPVLIGMVLPDTTTAVDSVGTDVVSKEVTAVKEVVALDAAVVMDVLLCGNEVVLLDVPLLGNEVGAMDVVLCDVEVVVLDVVLFCVGVAVTVVVSWRS